MMDNASWIQDARILSCGAESMIAPLQAFARLLIKYTEARIFMLFNDRTKGKEADAISKALLRLPEFGGLMGWQYAADHLVDRGFPRLDLTNMLEPRVEGVRADANRVSRSGCGVLTRCKAARKQLEAQSTWAHHQLAFYSNIDELLSSS